jgi:ribosomal protein L13
MPVLKARNRVVYFRVSEDEFHDFSEMCQAANARSLSDLARSAMQRMLKEQNEGEMIAERLKTFDELMARVNQKLVEMGELIQKNTPGGSQ